jgi:hypothetical protein
VTSAWGSALRRTARQSASSSSAATTSPPATCPYRTSEPRASVRTRGPRPEGYGATAALTRALPAPLPLRASAHVTHREQRLHWRSAGAQGTQRPPQGIERGGTAVSRQHGAGMEPAGGGAPVTSTCSPRGSSSRTWSGPPGTSRRPRPPSTAARQGEAAAGGAVGRAKASQPLTQRLKPHRCRALAGRGVHRPARRVPTRRPAWRPRRRRRRRHLRRERGRKRGRARTEPTLGCPQRATATPP